MTALIYAALAIAFLFLVRGILRKPSPLDPEGTLPKSTYAPKIGNGRWLHLSERIFDASDARWLAEELAFPKLAKVLTRERKRLAIQWLQALQASFDEVLRTPDLSSDGVPEANVGGNWNTFWLTVRFKIMVSYALLAVRLFGPYHRLIPSFSWVPFYRESKGGFGRTALAHNRISR